MIKIEDLLGLKQSKLDNKVFKNNFKDKIILITGAAGFIGSEISKQITGCKTKQIILVDQAESELYNLQQYFKLHNINVSIIIADISNENSINKIFEKHQPNIIFHVAAYKHVPLMEENPYEAVSVNVLGTKIIADLALKYQTEKFVLISTDKAVNPTSVMGATKRTAEMYITCLNGLEKTKFVITRFGNVLGSNGSVIPLFEKQIKNGGPITVTHKEIMRYFMTVKEACQLVLEAGALGKGGEIYVFDMGKSVKIYDLAKNMIRLSGLKYPEDINIKIIGLRLGEKLREELLFDSEKTVPTHHKKIKIAMAASLNDILTKDKIDSLCSLKQSNNATLVASLKTIVPEYISNNSVFEKLDKKVGML